MITLKRIVKDSGQVFASRITVIISRLLIIYFLTTRLGINDYGIYAFLNMILIISSLLASFGIGYSNIFYIAKDKKNLSLSITNSIVLAFLIGGILGGLLQLSPWFFPKVFHDIKLRDLIIIGISIPVFTIHRFITDAINGLENYKLYYFSFSGVWGTNLLLILLFLFFKKLTLSTAILAFFSAYLIIAGTVIYRFYKINLIKPILSFSFANKQLKYGLPLYFRDLFNQINFRFVYLIIKRYLDSSTLGAFALAVQAAEVHLYIPRAMFTVLLPKFSKNTESKGIAFTKILLSFFLFFTPLLMISNFVFPFIVNNFLSTDYSASILLFRILLPGILFLGILNIIESYLIGTENQKIVMFASGLSAIFLIPLAFILIPKYGVNFAAILSSSIYMFYLILTYIGIRKFLTLRGSKQ